MNKQYLGDSVYIEFDESGVILSTENGYPDDPRNIIVLENEVLENLFLYVAKSPINVKFPDTSTETP